MIGSPGTGKSMLAERLPTILPPLTPAESLETTRIYSATGRLSAGEALLTVRPFRTPHHTISDAGMVGGGNPPAPGEISKAPGRPAKGLKSCRGRPGHPEAPDPVLCDPVRLQMLQSLTWRRSRELRSHYGGLRKSY